MLLLPALKLKELLKVENIIREVKKSLFWHNALHFISAGKNTVFFICFSPSSYIHHRCINQVYPDKSLTSQRTETLGESEKCYKISGRKGFNRNDQVMTAKNTEEHIFLRHVSGEINSLIYILSALE